MEKKFVVLFASIIAVSLIFSPYQPTVAETYIGHDGSVDKHLSKLTVEPYKGKKNLWTYIVGACADSYPIAVAEIILKSDMEQVVLGVNKNIKPGKCLQFGAVMKAKDGKTLGAEMIEKHEAVDKMIEIVKNSSGMTKKSRNTAIAELIHLSQITGIMPRL